MQKLIDREMEKIDVPQVNRIIVAFTDNEDVYGRIWCNVNDIETIQKLLDKYRERTTETGEGYNIDDFYSILENENIDFEIVPIDEAYEIYF